MGSINLCVNCLENGATPHPIGPDKGPQTDPMRDMIHLCPNCWGYLLSGDLPNFHGRYSESRMISREYSSARN